jgi:uncharacterized lipoprotein YddW (UPF0748 family)
MGSCLKASGAALALLLVLAAPALADQIVQPAPDEPPEIAREFRGAWVATVGNIDWPSSAGLSTARQQTELIDLLDKAAALHLNAVILQVRPACDALYDSPYEPWSEYLTGHQGRPPSPYYDPLAFAVTQAHLRGLELHAWFNPYRARVLNENTHLASPADPRHISVTRPDLVRTYGHYLWLDPGEPDVMAHSLQVMLDVVKRYDIDAVHMDDYFYPYREPLYTVGRRAAQNVHGKPLYQPFPDKVSYARYVAGGGPLRLEDWRRDNVNRFIQALYKGVKETKPWVKVGLSPFGIWKPGHPSQIKGMSQYDSIYADARKWLREGWCDYFVPQLYWPIENPDQSYPVLLSWWADQNFQGRHLWPGLFTSRVGDDSGSPWDPKQIQYQIGWTRLQKGASGHVHFSLITLAKDRSHLSQKLRDAQYLDQALVPNSPWLGTDHPNKPKVTFARDAVQARLTADWQVQGGAAPWLWTVYVRTNGKWASAVYPLAQHMLSLDFQTPGQLPDALEIGAVDRLGNESDRARFVFASPVALPAAALTPAPTPARP